MEKNIETVLFVSEKNKYSYSPLLIIAEQFSFIHILYIKEDLFQQLDEDVIRRKVKDIFSDFTIKPDVFYIALFSFNSWYRKHFCILSDELSSIMPNGLRIAGGPDPTGDFLKLLPYFDAICVGEGEFFLYQLYSRILQTQNIKATTASKVTKVTIKSTIQMNLSTLYNCISLYDYSEFDTVFMSKRLNTVKEISNLKSVVNKQYSIQEFQAFISFIFNWHLQYNPAITHIIGLLLDTITCPEEIFSIFPVFPVKNLFFHPIELIRGCSTGCFFCQTSFIYGKALRFKNIEIVKEAIKFQLKNKKKYIRFISPDFLSYYSDNNKVNYEILKTLYNTAFQEDSTCNVYMGSFPSEISPNMMDENVMQFLRKHSVNENITIGIQTFSTKLQHTSNRKTDVDKIFDILSYSNKYFTVILDIIFGLPNENDGDREQTINILETILNDKVNANIHFFLPLPGTPFAKKRPEKVNNNHMKNIMLLFSKGFVKGNFLQQYNEYMNRLTLPKSNNGLHL